MRQNAKSPHIFFSVGEPSGDLHGANLITQLRALDPNIHCVGFGGPRMQQAGCDVHYDLTQLAVMWFVRVLLNIHRFVGLLRMASRYFRENPPDAVVLIDYPGFNWWVARRAKAHGIPVFYYGTPQLWAWAGWRIKKMRRLTDHVLCKLPFEPSWFERRGCRAMYVGHPYFDELAGRQLDLGGVATPKSTRRLITILPGSRDQEVTANLPMFLDAAQQVHARCGDTRFAIASFDKRQANLAHRILAKYPGLPVEVVVQRTAELIHAADCCLACSGSVSLELLYHAKPSVIGYRVGHFAYWAQNKLRTVKFITLANLIAEPDIFCPAGSSSQFVAAAENALLPEFLTCTDRSSDIANLMIAWLTDDAIRESVKDRLTNLRDQHAQPGASKRAAEYIYRQLTSGLRGRSARPGEPMAA